MTNEATKRKKNCAQFRKRARNKRDNRKIGSKRARKNSDVDDEDLTPWAADQLEEEREEAEMMMQGDKQDDAHPHDQHKCKEEEQGESENVSDGEGNVCDNASIKSLLVSESENGDQSLYSERLLHCELPDNSRKLKTQQWKDNNKFVETLNKPLPTTEDSDTGIHESKGSDADSEKGDASGTDIHESKGSDADSEKSGASETASHESNKTYVSDATSSIDSEAVSVYIIKSMALKSCDPNYAPSL